MDTRQLVEILIQEHIFEAQQRDELLKYLQKPTLREVVFQIIDCIHPNEQKGCIQKKLAPVQPLRKHLFPEIHYSLIREILAQDIGQQLSQPSNAERINEIILQNVANPRALIAAVYREFIGGELTQGDIAIVENDLKEFSYIFEELNPPPPPKIQEQVQQILPDERVDLVQQNQQKLQKYLQELKEDIKDIPPEIIDYQLRELEIYCIENLLYQHQEPVLSQSQRDFIKDINATGQGISAKSQILAGSDIIRNLKILRKHVCGLDIYKIARDLQIGKNMKEESFRRHPSDKKIKGILFFGLSKAGKTTIKLSTLGYRMVRRQIRGIWTVQPQNPNQLREEHQDLVIGYSNKSTTRFPKLTQIPEELLPRGFIRDRNYKCYLIDSAGLQDSQGAETEIPNRISFTQFIQDVDKVSIVIVISEKNWGTRGEDIVKLALSTSKMIRDLDETKITFVFNNFSPQFKQTFHSNVQDLYNNKKQQGRITITKNFQRFFEELLFQTQKLAYMLVVDPLQMNIKQFLQCVGDNQLCTDRTYACFNGDIGPEASEAVDKLCSRCAKQFKNHLAKNNVSAALYYITLLQKIRSLPRIQSMAQYYITSLEEEFVKKIQQKIKEIKLEFKQFDISFIRDKKARKQKLANMKEQYMTLETQVKCFCEIFPNPDLENKLKSFLPESFINYEFEIQKWKYDNCDITAINIKTTNAIDFYEAFGTQEQKEALTIELENILQNFRKFSIQIIKKEQRSDKLTINFLRLKTLSSILEKNLEITEITSFIDKNFNEKRRKISFVNLMEIENIDIQSSVASVNDVDEEKTNIESLLLYIEIIRTYPLEIITHVKNDAQEINKILLQKAPNSSMRILERKLKDYENENEDDNQDEDDSTKEAKDIEETKQYVKILKMFDKIQKINESTDNRISQVLQRLTIFITIKINKFQRICSAFKDNEEEQIKKEIKKLKSLIRKLEKIVKITQSTKLEAQFKDSKENLGIYITNYIREDFYEEKITFGDRSSVMRLLIKKQRLEDLKPIAKILGNQNNFQVDLKEEIEKLVNCLLEPIKILKQEITGEQATQINLSPQEIFELKIKRFNVRKIAKMIDFNRFLREKVEKVGNIASSVQFLLKVKLLESDIVQGIKTLYELTIEAPLQELNLLFGKSISDNESLESMIKELSQSKIKLFKKLLILLFEINQKTQISQYLQQNAQRLEMSVEESMQDMQRKIEIILQESPSFAIAQKLKNLVFLLKNLQMRPDRKPFHQLYEATQKKYRELDNVRMIHLHNFQKEGNEPQYFNENEFKELYNNQKREDRRRELDECLKEFKRKIIRRLKDLKLEISCEDELQKAIKNLFHIINKFLKTQSTLNISNRLLLEDIVDLDQFLDFGINKLIQFYDQDLDIINLKQIDAKQILRDLRPIEAEITELKEFRDLQKYDDFLLEKKFNTIEIYFKKQRSRRDKVIQQLIQQDQGIEEILYQEETKKIVNALDSETKKLIANKINNILNQKISNLRDSHHANYRAYRTHVSQIQNMILYFPENTKESQQNFSNIMKEITTEQGKFLNETWKKPLKDLCEIVLEKQNSENQCLLKQLAEKIDLRPTIIDNKQEDSLLMLIEIQSLAPQIQRLCQMIRKAFQKLEDRCIKRAFKKVQSKLWSYKDDYSDLKYEDEQNLEISSLSSQREKVWVNILQLIYQFEQNEVSTSVFPDNKEEFQKLTHNLTTLFNNLTHAGKQINSSLQSILYDPLNVHNIDSGLKMVKKYENTLQAVFQSKLNLRDVGVRSTKNQIIKLKDLKDQLISKVKKLEQETLMINAEKQMEFYEEKIRDKIMELQQNQRIWMILREPCYTYLGYVPSKTPEDKKTEREESLKTLEGIFIEHLQICKINPGQPFNRIISYVFRFLQLLSETTHIYLNISKGSFQFIFGDMNTKIALSQEKLQIDQNNLFEDAASADGMINQLVFLEKISTIPEVHKKISEYIRNKFAELKTKDYKFEKIKKKLLQRKDNYYAQKLYNQFCQQVQTDIFNNQQPNLKEQILKNMLNRKVLSQGQKDAFSKQIKIFQEELEKNFEKYQNEKSDKDLIAFIKDPSKKFREDLKNFNPIKIDERVCLLSRVCALGCIRFSLSKNQQKIMLRPHISQVICALLMIGADGRDSEMLNTNRLCQVNTGEGKSLIVAIVAIYFALLGYQVYCGCYSQLEILLYKTEYDRLVELCGVKNQIFFGSMKDHIQRLLKQKSIHSTDETFFSTVKNLIGSSSEQKFSNGLQGTFSKFQNLFGKDDTNNKKDKRILIFDQIQSLFNPNFYADSFSLAFTLRDPQLKTLFSFIWRHRNNPNLDYEMVQESQEFKNFISTHMEMEPIFENQIYGMLSALNTYQSLKYEIKDKTIFYKQNNQYKTKHSGYEAVYAYLEEFEAKNVSESSKNDNMYIELKVGEFSYAILAAYYNNIVGVTSSLKLIEDNRKKDLIKKYKISQKEIYKIPAAYQDCCEIKEPIITERESHYQELVNSISEEHNKTRPVLVFFQDKTKLQNFRNSQEFRYLQQKCKTLYLINQHGRDSTIKNASNESVTLLTREFFRGTHFPINKQKVNENGGYHLIVTYFIESLEEYQHAIGRVNRHGNKSSFIEIFCEEELKIVDLDRSATTDDIKRKREERYIKEIEVCQKKLIYYERIHEKTIRGYIDPSINQQKLVQHILQLNRYQKVDRRHVKKIKTMLIIDATADANQLVKNLQIQIPQIMSETHRVLRNTNFVFQLQIVFIKNYYYDVCSILEYSVFDSQGKQLQEFLGNRTINHQYAAALEIGLQYANSVEGLNEIIYVGGSTINDRNKIHQLRNRYSGHETKRNANKMLQTSCSEEVEKLALKNVRINTYFYRYKSLQVDYSSLSNKTCGECSQINYSNIEGIKNLLVGSALRISRQ